MAFFKKIVKIVQDNIGILTVVCPEVIIKKGWNANTDQVNDMMKVPAKQFYNYLGHWLTPDIGLKSGTYTEPYTPHEEFKGRGLGIGPFSYDPQSQCHNDLTKALDSQLYSNPGVCHRQEINYDKAAGGTEDDEFEEKVLFHFHSETSQEHGDTESKFENKTLYSQVEAKTFIYDWVGNWGDQQDEYETEVRFEVIQWARNDRVFGNWKGDYWPTGMLSYCWCGDENDYDKTPDPNNYHKGHGTVQAPASISNASFLKKFYNPYFASGTKAVNNDGKMNEKKVITITRRPFSQKLRWHFVIYTRGGYNTSGIYQHVKDNMKPPLLSSLDGLIGNITSKVGVGNPNVFSKLWAAICEPLKFLDMLFKAAFGYEKPHHARGSFTLKKVGSKVAEVNQNSCKAYPIMMNFGQISEWSYFYNQFEYPYFDRNPCHPFTTTFHYEKPFLENKVVDSDYHFKNRYYDHKLGRKYKYFVPNLFRLTFETNPGVFIEQLSKQNEGKIQHPDGYSLLTKLEHHTSRPDVEVQREEWEIEPYLDQIVFPTNFDVWNSYIENGYPDDASAGNLSWLQNFISSATNAATLKSPVMPLPYANALNRDYPFCDVNTVAEINQIIGLHSHIKTILESDKGYDVDTWSALCADPTQFQTLSSGVPKNLTYKLIEFMLWYLNKDGIAFKTRQSVKNLIAYEEYLDQRLEEYKGIPDVTDIDKFHTIGTQLYDRRCTESA